MLHRLALLLPPGSRPESSQVPAYPGKPCTRRRMSTTILWCRRTESNAGLVVSVDKVGVAISTSASCRAAHFVQGCHGNPKLDPRRPGHGLCALSTRKAMAGYLHRPHRRCLFAPTGQSQHSTSVSSGGHINEGRRASSLWQPIAAEMLRGRLQPPPTPSRGLAPGPQYSRPRYLRVVKSNLLAQVFSALPEETASTRSMQTV